MLLLALASAEMGSNDSCPPNPPVGNFSARPFSGAWFVRATRGIPTDLECRYDYVYDIGDGKIQSFTQAIRKNSNQTFLGDGLLRPITQGLGRFNLKLSWTPGSSIFDYIYVEYDRLAICLICLRLKMGAQVKTHLIIIVKTRDRNLNSTIYEERLEELGLNPESMTKMRQENCPEAEEPCTVTEGGLRKRCHEC